MNKSTQLKKDLQVSGRVENYTHYINELQKTLDKLEARISSILHPAEQGNTTEAASQETGLAPLAMEIQGCNEMLRGSILRLTDIIGRVEL